MGDLPNIEWVDVGKVLVGLLPTLTVLAGVIRGPGVFRSRLKHDVELLEKIPTGTRARSLFEDYLAAQVERFADFETKAERHWPNVLIGAPFTLVVLGLTVFLLSRDDWWWWAVATVPFAVALAALVVVYEAALRVPRDEDKKPL